MDWRGSEDCAEIAGSLTKSLGNGWRRGLPLPCGVVSGIECFARFASECKANAAYISLSPIDSFA